MTEAAGLRSLSLMADRALLTRRVPRAERHPHRRAADPSSTVDGISKLVWIVTSSLFQRLRTCGTSLDEVKAIAGVDRARTSRAACCRAVESPAITSLDPVTNIEVIRRKLCNACGGSSGFQC